MKLLPAVRTNRKIFVGQPDESHQYIKESNGIDDGPDSIHGFVPDGNYRMWLSRKSALSWLKRFEPDVYRKVINKVPPEGLHSSIYSAAKGIVQKLTKEAKKEGFPIQPAEKRENDKQQGETKKETEVDLKDITLVMVDHGISEHLAEKLAESYKNPVYLYIPNIEAYPNTDRDEIGTGIEGVQRLYTRKGEDGTERPTYKEFLRNADKEKTLIFFPDVGFAEDQKDLIAQGFKVCGSLDSDRLELDKWYFQQEIEKAGLPTTKTVRLVGMSNLKKYVADKSYGSCFIKISFHRGLTETKRWLGMFLSSVWLKDLEVRLGRKAETQIFLVQDKIDSIGEIGMDTSCLNGVFMDNALCGLEIKDAGYFCKVFEKQPEPIQKVNEKLSPLIKKLGMAGLFSHEIRFVSKDKGYVIDLTQRMPSPPGELMPEMYKKHEYARMLWELANGRMYKPEIAWLYGVEIILTSSWLEGNHWLPIEFPKEGKRYIRLKNYCIRDDGYYIIPSDNGGFFGGAIGFGNTPDEACKMGLKWADSVKGEDVKYEPDVLEKAQKGMEKMKAIGITF